MKVSNATAEVFFTAFKMLKNSEKEAFLEKIISDPMFREDLIDIVLIQQAKKAKGKTISAAEYFAKRHKAG